MKQTVPNHIAVLLAMLPRGELDVLGMKLSNRVFQVGEDRFQILSPVPVEEAPWTCYHLTEGHRGAAPASAHVDGDYEAFTRHFTMIRVVIT